MSDILPFQNHSLLFRILSNHSSFDSIAKYTPDYVHLERCTPSLPETLLKSIPSVSDGSNYSVNHVGQNNYTSSTSIAMNEIYRALESPKRYYSTVADSIQPAQTARLPSQRPLSRDVHDEGQNAQPAGGVTSGEHVGRTSPQRQRTLSRSSTTLGAPALPLSLSNSSLTAPTAEFSGDAHINASEPRVFPGLVHQRERRRSLRTGSSGVLGLSGEGYTDPDQVPGSGADGGQPGSEKLSKSVESLKRELAAAKVEEEGESEEDIDDEDSD